MAKVVEPQGLVWVVLVVGAALMQGQVAGGRQCLQRGRTGL